MTPLILNRITERLSAAADGMDASYEGLNRAGLPAVGSGICGPAGLIVHGSLSHPLLAATIPYGLQGMRDKIHGFSPGDVFLGNDPFSGGSSLADLRMFAPFFAKRELLFFVGNVVRYPDLGGRAPGGFSPGATEVHQEGIVIPWRRFRDKEGKEPDPNLVDFLASNARFDERFRGMLQSQVDCLDAGLERLRDLVDRYGVDAVREAEIDMARRAEGALTEEIRDFPDGCYGFEDVLDGDGVVDRGMKIVTTVRVAGQVLQMDFRGSDGPSTGPLNCPSGLTAGACRVALRNLFPGVPAHTAAFHGISISLPESSFLNARSPQPVSGSIEVAGRVAAAVTAALAGGDPARAGAMDFVSACHLSLHGKADGFGDYLMTLSMGGGLGASARGDGLTNGSGFSTFGEMPALEDLEERYPIRVLKYAVRPGSGGAGRYRGGMGVSFSFELLSGEAVLTLFGDRYRRGAEGLMGGTRGAKTGIRIIRGYETRDPRTEQIILPTKAEGIVLKAGDRVLVDTPGGGGYGHPYKRAIRLVSKDLSEGLSTRKQSAMQHGVIFEKDSLDYDSPRTFQLRSTAIALAEIENLMDEGG